MTVEVALRGAVEQTVTVVETRTDDAHCDRFGSIECETWADVAQCADMKVTGTDDAGYMTVHRKCWSSSTPRSLIISENWRLVPATLTPPVLSTVRTSQSGCCSEYHCLSLRWV